MDFCDGAEAESGGGPISAASGSRRTSGVTFDGGSSGGNIGGVGDGRGGGRRRSSAGGRGDRLRQRRESNALAREGRRFGDETPDVVVCDGLSADALPPRPEKFLFLFQISPPSFLRRPLSKGNISILGNTNDQRVNMKPCFITTSTDKN